MHNSLNPLIAKKNYQIKYIHIVLNIIIDVFSHIYTKYSKYIILYLKSVLCKQKKHNKKLFLILEIDY